MKTDDIAEEIENDQKCAFPQQTCDTQSTSRLGGVGSLLWTCLKSKVICLKTALEIYASRIGIGP